MRGRSELGWLRFRAVLAGRARGAGRTSGSGRRKGEQSRPAYGLGWCGLRFGQKQAGKVNRPGKRELGGFGLV